MDLDAPGGHVIGLAGEDGRLWAPIAVLTVSACASPYASSSLPRSFYRNFALARCAERACALCLTLPPVPAPASPVPGTPKFAIMKTFSSRHSQILARYAPGQAAVEKTHEEANGHWKTFGPPKARALDNSVCKKSKRLLSLGERARTLTASSAPGFIPSNLRLWVSALWVSALNPQA
jgi:hypothetical protein